MAEVNERNIEAFKKAYREALLQDRMTFTFEGAEVLVAYAKYLIEYFDSHQRRK